MDEHALSEAGSDDVAVGTALLMADLEAAIATAGAEIAVLRGVADAMPQARPVLPESAKSQPVVGDPDHGSDGAEREAAVPPEREPLVSPVPVAAPALAVETARTAAASLPDRNDAVAVGVEALPASVAAPVASPDLLPTRPAGVDPERSPRVDVRATVSRFETAFGTVAPTPERLPATAASAAASAIEARPENGGSHWAWPLPVAAAPPSAVDAGPTDAVSALPVFEAAVGRAAAPVGTSLLARSASGSADGGPVRSSAAADQDRGGTADASHTGPTEGDVFLDGERVGRWMARHLARELGGPTASGTAFDPRTGPAWPGALHGN